MDSKEIAYLVAEAAGEKKAREVTILDLRPLTVVTDYFVICSGTNPIQVKAIADHVREKLEVHGACMRHWEGYDNARWILMDYGAMVVHVFHEQERSFYNLERLWGDAEAVHF